METLFAFMDAKLYISQAMDCGWPIIGENIKGIVSPEKGVDAFVDSCTKIKVFGHVDGRQYNIELQKVQFEGAEVWVTCVTPAAEKMQ